MILTGLCGITRDAELRYMPNGEPVINLNLAYNYGNKDKDSGFRPSQYIEVQIFGERAEKLAQYLKKGSEIDCVIEDVHTVTYKKGDQTPGFKLVGRMGLLEFSRGNKQQSTNQRPSGRPGGHDLDKDDIPFE